MIYYLHRRDNKVYNKYDSKEQPIADELAINNMLIALEYSEKYSNIFSVR